MSDFLMCCVYILDICKTYITLNFYGWFYDLLSMMNFSDKPELHGRFVKLPLMVPQAPLVFSLKHTINSIKSKLLTGSLILILCKQSFFLF